MTEQEFELLTTRIDALPLDQRVRLGEHNIMVNGLLDTSVVIDLIRRYQPAPQPAAIYPQPHAQAASAQ